MLIYDWQATAFSACRHNAHSSHRKQKTKQKKWIQEDLEKIKKKKKKWLLNVGIWCAPENIYTADKSLLSIAFTEPNFGDIYVST